MLRHFRDDFAAFLDRPAKRNHEFYIRESHFLAHVFHRTAFEGESRPDSGDCNNATRHETQHRILFRWFVGATSNQIRIFIGFEVAEAHDHILRIERSGDHRDALCKLVDEELRFVVIPNR